MFKDDSDDEECSKCLICLSELMKDDLLDHVYSCLVSLRTLHGEPKAVGFLINKHILAEDFRGTDFKEIIATIKQQYDPNRLHSQEDCMQEPVQSSLVASKSEEENSIFAPKYKYLENYFLVPHHMSAEDFKAELGNRIAELAAAHSEQAASEMTLYTAVIPA